MMSHFSRLMDDPAADPTDVALIRFARSERMSDESRERILMGLGLGVASTVATTSVMSQAASSGLLTSKLKLIAALGLSAALGGTALWLLTKPTAVEGPGAGASESAELQPVPIELPVEQPIVADSPTVSETPRSLIEQPKPVPAEVEQRAQAPLPKQAAAPAAEQSRPTDEKESTSERPGGSLSDELAAIRRARLALNRGDAASALSAVAAYDRKFPTGRLRQEARVVQIEALVRLGRRDQAQRVAAPFLKSKSPYSERVRSLLER